MRIRTLLIALAAGLCAASPAFADPPGAESWQHAQRGDRGGRGEGGPPPEWGHRWDQDQARDGVQQGRIRPLGDIIRDLEGRYGGRLLGQELVQNGQRPFYRIRWMTGDGRRLDLVVDAQGR